MNKRFDDLLAAATRLDLDAIAADVAGFSAPKQERARQKTQWILAATAHLLEERAFETISILDIAQKAGCSPATIYSRFIDKNAIAPLAYMLVVEYYRVSEISISLLKAQSIDEICFNIISHYRVWFEENVNLSSMILSHYSVSLHRMVAHVVEEFVERINPIVANVLDADPSLTINRVRFALRVNTALFRDLNMVRAGGVETALDSDCVARTMALILSDPPRSTNAL